LVQYWEKYDFQPALEMVNKTLHAMRKGGIFDQIGFGFHQYSTDKHWKVPHFEKMLYNQALLLYVYSNSYQATQNNYYKKIKLNDLAQITGMSKYHLSRLFKKHTGYSPHEYLINYRLSQAKDLLKTTDLPIYLIANKLGFSSSSHFVKLFKKETNTTPLNFRKYWR
jgi:AraC-like DNA-binding protein